MTEDFVELTDWVRQGCRVDTRVYRDGRVWMGILAGDQQTCVEGTVMMTPEGYAALEAFVEEVPTLTHGADQ